MEVLLYVLGIALFLYLVHEFAFPSEEIQVEAFKEQVQELVKYDSSVIRVDWSYPFILNRAIGMPYWMVKMLYRSRFKK